MQYNERQRGWFDLQRQFERSSLRQSYYDFFLKMGPLPTTDQTVIDLGDKLLALDTAGVYFFLIFAVFFSFCPISLV